MLKSLAPNLMVENVPETIAFYSDLLGFETAMSFPEEGDPVWAMLKSGEVTIMLQGQQSLQDDIPGFTDMPIGASATLFIETDDVETLYTSIKDKADIVKDIETTFYGMREVSIRDCNGYILTFAQRVQQGE